jgi:hypothetical protein
MTALLSQKGSPAGLRQRARHLRRREYGGVGGEVELAQPQGVQPGRWRLARGGGGGDTAILAKHDSRGSKITV